MGCLAPTPGFTSSGNAGRSRGCGLREAANLRWVAWSSCLKIMGCSAYFARCSEPLTAVADLVQELRRKTMKKRGAKGRI